MGGASDDDIFSAKWFRGFVLVGVFGGAGGNLAALNQTDDRFRGADFYREMSIRDTRIAELEHKQHSHLEHSATYTQVIKQLQAELARLTRQYEKHIMKHDKSDSIVE